MLSEDHFSFADAVIALFDEQCDRWLDVEYRTIGRRLLARAVLNDPTLIRRSSSPVRFAAGLAHAVLAANDRIGRAEGQLRAKDIGAWFGSSSAGDPARTHRLWVGDLSPDGTVKRTRSQRSSFARWAMTQALTCDTKVRRSSRLSSAFVTISSSTFAY